MADFIQQFEAGSDRRLYQQLVESLADFPLFAVDLNRRITSWNPAVAAVFGYSEQEFIGSPLEILSADEEQQRGLLEQEIQQAIQTGSASAGRWYYRKDGTRFFAESVLAPLKDYSGLLIGCSIAMRDDTARYLAGKAQQEQGRRAQLLADILKRLLAETDPAQLVPDICAWIASEISAEVWCNYAFEEERRRLHLTGFGGISEHEAKKTEWLVGEFLNDAAKSESALVYKDLGQAGSGLACLKQTGAQAYIVCPLLAGADLLGAVAFATRQQSAWQKQDLNWVQDVTAQISVALERVRPARELQNRNDALQRSNDDLAQFSSVVSHDLQAPLRAIKSYTQLLDRRLRNNLGDAEQEFMGYINQGATQMESLIHGLLHYAQVGQEQIEKTPVSIAGLVDKVRVILQPAITENEARIHCEALPELTGDPVQLQQLFQNLIANAIKYRRPEPAPEIRISADRVDDFWRFSVADNGIGIPAEYAEKIFAPLQRLHGAEIPGTGIGLSVCKKIVERHGGQIWACSEVGRGSTFFFTLPA